MSKSLMSVAKKQFSLKTPKGTKDWDGHDMVVRQKVFDSITRIFRRHGGVTIDTPVFELREILAGKYGEDSKLIYNLEDQGGELTSLRYDLTVPFARYVAANKIEQIKRYHIAKVYRRDQPAMTKGRMREFYQCDFDIAGTYEAMVPDAECLAVAVETLKGLGIKKFTIKLNHRKVLDGIFTHCGVPEDKVRTISSAVDKLDKLPWEAVRNEMTEEKGLDGSAADKIGVYVRQKGTVAEMVTKLESDELMKNETALVGLEDMRKLLTFLDAYNIADYVSFDLSLARGLDYYTGLIYEAVTPQSWGEDGGVGSIAAGGRYDNLVGMFSAKRTVPCVGISFGVERIFSLLKQTGTYAHLKPSATQVFVMALGGGKEWNGFLPERMRVAQQLWNADIAAEFLYKTKPNLQKQFEAAERNGCTLGVILGQEEFAKGIVKVKKLGQGAQSDQGTDVKLEDLPEFVGAKLAEVNLNESTSKLSVN